MTWSRLRLTFCCRNPLCWLDKALCCRVKWICDLHDRSIREES